MHVESALLWSITGLLAALRHKARTQPGLSVNTGSNTWPAFVGEEIEIKTWVENVRRVRSLRKSEFIRKSDGKLLVRGETDWVFVDSKTGSPLAIPEEVSKIFDLSPHQ